MVRDLLTQPMISGMPYVDTTVDVCAMLTPLGINVCVMLTPPMVKLIVPTRINEICYVEI